MTHYVADFVVKTTFADIPPVVLDAGRKSILDGIGLAFSGSVAESGDRSRKYVTSLGLVPGKSTVIGSGLKVAPRFAAFANGVAIHADDYDDTQLAVADGPRLRPAHASDRARAAGRAGHRRGDGRRRRDVMLAYHLGVEVECKIAEAINPRHYQTGFHADRAPAARSRRRPRRASSWDSMSSTTRRALASPAASRPDCAKTSAP